MIVEAGHFALALALMLALVQASFPLIGAARNDARWMAMARPAAVGQLAFVAAAFLSLIYAFVTSDFSVGAVVANSHSAKPLLYKIAGTWGNHEGSMLLWVLILSLFGAAVAVFGDRLRPTFKARVLGVQGILGAAFLAFVLFASNPFLRIVPAPLDGRGLNPLLQDPGLAFHPPFLYLGYVGFSMAFSFAVAALIEGRVEPAWARWVRPWTLAAWAALTLGIALGSWWAYYELGWGGFWFWDPVENASLLPWLTGTALLHSLVVVEKRAALKSWTVLLAIVTFGLSLVGTFLVRSGVLISVHAFASDPGRGLFILALFVGLIGGALALYALRAAKLAGGGSFAAISREGGLVLNNLLLSAATATVFIGTLYPLFLDAIGGGRVSVGPPFFTATFVPLAVPLVAAMGIGPMLAWKRADLAGVLARLKLAGFAAGAVAVVSLYLDGARDILAALGVALAVWLFAAVLIEWAERARLFRAPFGESMRRAAGLPRAAYGASVAHAGLAVAVAGIVASTAWQSEHIGVMRPGERAVIAGYEVVFAGVRAVQGPNYSARQGRFAISRGGRSVAVLEPEKRVYPVTGTPTTEAAIHTTWFADIYAVLGDPDGKGGWTVRLYHNPLVPWIWVGAIIMVLGAGLSLTDRRLRVGIAARAASVPGAGRA